MEILLALAIIVVCSATLLMMVKGCVQATDIVDSWACAFTGGANFAMVVYWIIQMAEFV